MRRDFCPVLRFFARILGGVFISSSKVTWIWLLPLSSEGLASILFHPFSVFLYATTFPSRSIVLYVVVWNRSLFVRGSHLRSFRSSSVIGAISRLGIVTSATNLVDSLALRSAGS